MPSRFGILPRYGTNADVKWFEASPCYIYHVVNAWEDGDEFVMEACRVIQAEPGAKRGEGELAGCARSCGSRPTFPLALQPRDRRGQRKSA